MTQTTPNLSIKKIIAIVVILGLACLLLLFWLSCCGKCKLGESLYFANTKNEMCAPIGTIIDTKPGSMPQASPSQNASKSMKLKIHEQKWSGWSKAQPPAKDWTVTLDSSTQRIELGGLSESDTYFIEPTVLDEQSVKVTIHGISVGVSDQSDKSGIDLSNCKDSQEVILSVGETVMLYTCTMDAGVKWQVGLAEE